MTLSAQEIADSLTRSQRELLLDPDPFAIDDAMRFGRRGAHALSRRGLIHSQLSPEGLEVRAILIARAAQVQQ